MRAAGNPLELDRGETLRWSASRVGQVERGVAVLQCFVPERGLPGATSALRRGRRAGERHAAPARARRASPQER